MRTRLLRCGPDWRFFAEEHARGLPPKDLLRRSSRSPNPIGLLQQPIGRYRVGPNSSGISDVTLVTRRAAHDHAAGAPERSLPVSGFGCPVLAPPTLSSLMHLVNAGRSGKTNPSSLVRDARGCEPAGWNRRGWHRCGLGVATLSAGIAWPDGNKRSPGSYGWKAP